MGCDGLAIQPGEQETSFLFGILQNGSFC